MLYLIISLIISFVECALLFMTARNILSVQKGRIYWFYIFLVLDFICSVVIGYIKVPIFISLSINMLIEIVFLGIICNGTLKSKILLVFSYDIGIMLVDFLVFMIAQSALKIDKSQILDINLESSILSIISKSIICLLLLFLIDGYNKKLKRRILNISPVVYIVPVISIVMLCILLDYSMNVQLTSYKNTMLYIAMAFVLLLNIFLLYVCEKLQEYQEQKISMEMMQQELEYYEELKKSYEQIKRVKHDYDKQINVMSALIHDNEYDKLKEFFESELEESRFNVVENYTGNTVFDAIINQKRMIAIDKKLQFFVEAEKIEGNSLNPFHICILLGNVLDNAIEGAERSL